MTIWNIDDAPAGGSVASPDEQAIEDFSVVTAFTRTLLDDVTAAEARTTLGVPNTAELASSTAAAAAALAAHVASLAASSGSSLAGFLQAGAGAVARTVQAKMRDVVSVKDYGAVGDGSTDDTAAINAALAAAYAVYFPTPSVYYKTTTGLSATTARHLFGDGAWGTGSQIECTDAAVDILTFPTRETRFIYIHDLNLRHTTKGAGDGIVLVAYNPQLTMDRVYIENCDIAFYAKNEAFLQTYNQCRAQGCNTGFYAEGRTAALAGAGTTIIYNQCYANDCNIGFNTLGITEVYYVQPAIDFLTTNTTPTGIYAQNCHTVHVKQLHIETFGTVLGANGHGVRIENSTMRYFSLDGASISVDATGFTWYVYALGTTTGIVRAEVSGVYDGGSTNVKECDLQNSDGGAIYLTKRGNRLGNISGFVTGNLAGFLYTKDEDTDLASVLRIDDDFWGDTLDARWNGRVGSDAECAAPAILADQIGGLCRLTTGNDAAATMAVNGVQLESGLNWRADRYGLSMEVRFVPAGGVTFCAWFIGFTDQNSALEMPFTLAAGDALTSNASDAVGILYDTAADTDNWWLVGVKANVDATKQNAGVAPVNATYEIWRIEVSWTGGASFFRNGVQIGTAMASAVTRTVGLTPVVCGFTRGGVQRFLDLDYTQIRNNRG